MSRPSHLTTYTDEQYADMIKKARANRAAKIASNVSKSSNFNVFNVPDTCEVCEKIKRDFASDNVAKHMSVG